MSDIFCIKTDARDNVAVAVAELPPGVRVDERTVTLETIPQAHKVALHDIPQGGEVIRYGIVLGCALRDIPAGSLINEHMLLLPSAPTLENLEFGTNIVTDLPEPPVNTFEGYDNGDGYAGTRNLLGISTTVQCVAGAVNAAVELIRKKILPLYPNVEDVVPLNHAYGCGVAVDAPDAEIPIRTIRNLLHHPNFGGEVMLVGLGCEMLLPELLLNAEENTPENVLMLQDCKGFEAMIDAIVKMAERKLESLNRRVRQTLPLSKLLIGMQCGGSDAFSGITANPAAGYAADMLVKGGATVLFSETSEVRDGVQLLAARIGDARTCARLAEEMRWYDNYLASGGIDRSANPAPGNKKGGLSNIVEKAMGTIAKSGTSPIVEVLSPGERPSKHGLIYASTPASDMVCGPCQLASGITLQVFMTGRGTPYGLAMAPVVKVCSRTAMKEQWPDLIDINAGTIATGNETVQDVGVELFHFIIDVAGGRKKTWAEKYKLHNDMCIFNTVPIT